jgi:hypothetical protein
VQGANRVVEEYLRAGEAAGRTFMGAGVQPGSPQDLGQAMVRAASDMMTFWVELMARSAGTSGFAAPEPRQSPAASPTEAARAAALKVRVDVESARPADVLIDLRTYREGAALRVERLHARDGSSPPLGGGAVRLAVDDGVLIVRLRIPPAQRPGHYRGVVVDEATSAPVGTLAVDVQPRGSRKTARR